jgi:hypothetical protein
MRSEPSGYNHFPKAHQLATKPPIYKIEEISKNLWSNFQYIILKHSLKAGMIVHACNLSIQEAEAGGF